MIQIRCQMFVYSGHALSYTSYFSGIPLKLKPQTNDFKHRSDLKQQNRRDTAPLTSLKFKMVIP